MNPKAKKKIYRIEDFTIILCFVFQKNQKQIKIIKTKQTI
jgi:hypothetical protein